MDKLKILVAEDDLALASALEEMLRYMDYVVVGPYHTLESALIGAELEDFDAALLDINLGGEKVFELAAMLEVEQTPFLFMSGLADSLPEYLAKHYRCVDKGTLVDELEDEIRTLVNGPLN